MALLSFKEKQGTFGRLGRRCVSRTRETLEGKKDKEGFFYQFAESSKGNRSEEDLKFGFFVNLDPIWSGFNESFRKNV